MTSRNHKNEFLVALITLYHFGDNSIRREKEKKNYELRDCFYTFLVFFLARRYVQKETVIRTIPRFLL